MANSASRANLNDRSSDSHEAQRARERILLVESDPTISDLIGRQALQSVGYQVQVAPDATNAIARALQWSPDLILVDLNLPGLSGKDLLVALTAQGVQTPLIIIAARGMEADLIQTFRLGAADYLLLPAREAEVVNAVNRVLQQVRDRRERDRLSQQLQQANQDLQNRVRELTTIFALGKAMTSITDQAVLYDKILEGAVRITQADLGWFLLRDQADRPFVLAAGHNLSQAVGARLNQPWDDGISSLVAMSGEPLAIYGDPLKRFKISSLGLAALITPIKAQKTVAGLLVMMRRQPVPFGAAEQHLLGALADYAAISLVNARLFRAVEDRARTHQQAAEAALVTEKVQVEIMRLVKQAAGGASQAGVSALERLATDPTLRWRADQRQQLTAAQEQFLRLHQIADALEPLELPKAGAERAPVTLNELLVQTVRRMQAYAQQAGIKLSPEIPREPLVVLGSSALLQQALDGVMSSALKNSAAGGQVVIQLSKTSDHEALIRVRHSGRVLDPTEMDQALESPTQPGNSATAASGTRFSGLGIPLSLVKEIVNWHHGKTRLESQPGQGTTVHLLLPLRK